MYRQRSTSKPINLESRGNCSISYFKGNKNTLYEDRFRLLTSNVGFVGRRCAGQLYVVADGVGSAPRGASAAQHLCSRTDDFFKQPEECSFSSIRKLLSEINSEISGWGYMENTDRSLGACSASISWIVEDELNVFHSGDTRVWLFREGTCRSITRDHVNAEGHLISYFGKFGMECSCYREVLADGDRILMSSDGILSAGMTSNSLAEICSREHNSERIVQAVAEYAYHRTQDDVTFLCIEHDLE